MWRTALSVLLSAILGSAVATIVSMFGLLIWQGEPFPKTPEDLRILIAISFVASWFTIPGALLLAAVETLLSGTFRSERALDRAVIASGLLAGAAMLGGLSLANDPLHFAALSGFYGVTTAILFVLFQRLLGSRRERCL